MGLNLAMSDDRSDAPAPGDPRPDAYTVLSYQQFGLAAVVRLRYHHATNYGGEKVLVYESYRRIKRVIDAGDPIDPHFIEDDLSPAARFEPTALGYSLAIHCAEELA